MSQFKRILWCGTAVCLLAWLVCPTHADSKTNGAPAPKDSLAQYVPADVWLFSHCWRTPERDQLVEHWDKIIAALKTCGIDQEFRRAVEAAIPQEKKPTFDKKWDEISAVFGAVEWFDLIRNEFVIAERFEAAVPDFMLIARPDPKTFNQNVNGLIAIFDLINTYAVGKPVPAKINGPLRTWSIDLHNGDVGLHFLHIDEKIALVFGQSALSDVRSLLLGEKKIANIQSNAKFKRAVKDIPQAGHSLTYLDLDHLFTWVSKLPSLVLGEHDHAPPIKTVRKVVKALANHLDFIDYIIMSQEVSGDQEIQYTAVRIKADCCDKPFAKAISHQKPISNFTRFIPVESKSYIVSTMFDFRLVYDTIINTVKTKIPNGVAVCQKWESLQRDVQFDLRGDVLDWINGEIIFSTFPPLNPSPFMKEDTVTLFRIRDAKLARSKISILVDRGIRVLENSGQQPTLSPASKLPVDGFQSLTIPTMVMFIGSPCFGIWDDWFVLGTSEDAVALVMRTAAGDHPAITENDRFAREGLSTNGPIVSATFTDLSNIGQELSAAFFGFGFAAGMIQEETRAAPVKAILNSFVRLGPVVNKIDFLSSTSTLTKFKDNAWHSKSVTTYKSANK